MEIRGKRVLITGGAKRIGAFLSQELSKLGADIVLHYNLSENEANTVKRECEKHGVKVELVKADFSSPSAHEILTPFVRKSNVLICNASSFRKVELESISEDDIIRSIRVEFLVHFLLIKEMYLESRARNSLSKVIILSDARSSRRDFIPYHLGKKLSEYATEELARFFSPYVTINCISLGLALPPENKDSSYVKSLAEKIPMRREVKLEEIFSAVKFIIDNDYITGQIIRLSGGCEKTHTF